MSIESLGGRKFLLTLIALGIGTAVQILSPKGVTTEFAALLAALITSFGAANAFITARAQEEPAEPPPVDHSRVEKLEGDVDAAHGYVAQRLDAVELNIKNLAEITSVTAKMSENAAKLAKTALGLTA